MNNPPNVSAGCFAVERIRPWQTLEHGLMYGDFGRFRCLRTGAQVRFGRI